MQATGTTPTGNRTLYFFFVLSLLQLLPYFILREHTTIPVNDTMDAYVPQYSLTATKDYAWCSFNKAVPQVMNGLNRDLLVSDLSMIFVLFRILPSFWAFTVNLLLIKIIAFAAMYIFLKRNFRSFTQTHCVTGAFLFSCIPFFPFFGAGIAAQPLLADALIRIHKRKQDYRDYLVLLLFPFYSSLVFTNIFILASIALVCLYLLIRDKKIPFRLIGAAAVLLLLGVLVEYRLIHATMQAGFVPHRVEFDFGAFVTKGGIGGLLVAVFKILTTGIFHVETFYSVIVFALLVLCLLKLRRLPLNSLLFALIGYIAVIGLLFGLTHSGYYGAITHRITFLKAFQIDRFYTLLPFLYFLLGILCMDVLLKAPTAQRRLLLKGITMAAAALVFFNSFPLKALVSKNVTVPTYARYYDTEALAQVKAAIPGAPDTYRVAGIGIDPGVLQYNGFYTLDAYLNIYPLSYKQAFRPVIAQEIGKSEELKAYFESWGNRCYIFSAELGKDLNKQPRDTNYLEALNINTAALKALCDKEVYIVSTKHIRNSDTLGLQLVKEFSTGNNFRSDLVLYRVL